MCVAYSTSFRSMALLGVAGVIGGAQSERPHAPAREPGPKSAVECSGRRAAPAGAVHFGRRLLSRKRAAPLDRERPVEVGRDRRQLTGEWIGAEGIHDVVPRVAPDAALRSAMLSDAQPFSSGDISSI